MKRPDPPSDRDIADAFLALDGTIPDGHLDDFSSRVLARLDEPEASEMDSRELASGSGAAAVSAVPEKPAREENSGLHEIKALASTTRRRISQKITSDNEAEESLLVGASSGSFRAAALPDPARHKEPAERAADARPARAASEVDRRPLPARASSVPFWLLGGVAAAAAAAAVAVFVFGVGRAGEPKDQQAAKSDLVARSEAPAPEQAPAASAPADQGMQFAEPPPPAAGAAPAGAAAPAVATLGETRADEAAGGDGTAAVGGLKGRAGGAAEGKAVRDPARTEAEDKEKDAGRQRKQDVSKGAKPTDTGKDLNDVLDQVTGGIDTPAPVEKEGAKKPSKKGLDRSDVARAMGAVRAQVMRCRDLEHFEGTVTVKFHVAPSGEVTAAEATGSKAASKTGSCVAAAVKRARFPAFDGAPTSFTYPFLLAE
jgi:hypothetical protein